MEKIGKYQMQAESFHCDFTHHLQMGYLGNYMLNAADFHSTDRGFGMRYLFTLQRTWVLSRLCIEMEDMPEQYSHFTMETWVESRHSKEHYNLHYWFKLHRVEHAFMGSTCQL